MTYGVTVNGFNRKPLSVILSEIEQSNIAIFGPGVIQTPQSPMGQLNALRAALIAQEWEALEDVYQSTDPDQAEGARLDTHGRVRLISRMPGESDERLRQAITNLGAPNVRDADFYRAVTNVEGVTWARIYSNDTGSVDASGLAPHSVAVAAIGGDDEEIATVARQFVVPGISTSGNVIVSTTIDGFCRSINITRPAEVPVWVSVTVTKNHDPSGCPPPSNAAIAEALLIGLTGTSRPANGQDITLHMVRTAISCMFPHVEVMSAAGGRFDDTGSSSLPIQIGFFEIATLSLGNITITAV